MTTLTITRCDDTWVNGDATGRQYGSGRWIKLQSGSRQGFLMFPLAGVRGRTVLSAVLYGHAGEAQSSQTLSVQRVAGDWSPGKVTWANKPGVTGSTMTAALGALSAGQEFAVNVLDAIEAVANGATWYGLRVATSSGTLRKMFSQQSGEPAWRLVVELSDAPEQPTNLRPRGGGRIGVTKPNLLWDFTDLGGDSTEQGGYMVEIRVNGGTAWSTGVINSGDPMYAQGGGAPTPTAGDTVEWRVKTKDLTGLWSVWSDWAAYTYDVDPTLVIDSPTGATIGDPSPTILAHITSEELVAYRVRVTGGEDRSRVLYDSGIVDASGTNIVHAIPLRDPDSGLKVFRDESNRQINVRAWTDVERAVYTGGAAYIGQWVTVHVDDDAVTAPTLLTATEYAAGDPRTKLTWLRGSTADQWVIYCDDELVARLDPDEVSAYSGTYEWVDRGYAQPWVTRTWRVHAIENGDRSPGATANHKTKPEGLWLIPDDGETEPVVLDQTGVSGFRRLDRRATYKPTNTGRDVDIVYAYEGISGAFSGSIGSNTPNPGQTRRRIERLAKREDARPQMIWGTQSIPVLLRNLSALPNDNLIPDLNDLHDVQFEFIQDGD